MALLMLTKKEAVIIVDRLSRCMQTFCMPRISRAIATGFPHNVTQSRNHEGGRFEDSNDFREYLGWPRDNMP